MVARFILKLGENSYVSVYSCGFAEYCTYGLCILIGAVAGIGVALIRAKRRNFPVEDTLFLSFFALIGVGVGAKIYILLPFCRI